VRYAFGAFRARDFELDLMRALREAWGTTRIDRVENWATNRCTTNHPNEYYWLLRFFAPGEALDYARVVVNQAGFYTASANVQAGYANAVLQRWKLSSRSLADARARVTPKIGEPSSARLVHTFGTGEIACPETHPCGLFEVKGRHFILGNEGGLYEIETDRPRHPQSEVVEPSRRAALLGGSGDGNAQVLSIGNEGYAVASRVATLE